MTAPDRLEIDRVPSEPVRLVMCEWLRRHGVDPHEVVATRGWIERQPAAFRLAYLAYVRDVDGAIQFDAEANSARVEPRYVQLEGPPLPWPDLARHVGPREDEW